jgi:Ca-activated chloride channel family protein
MRSRRLRRRDWHALAQRGRSPRDDLLLLSGSGICLILAIAQPRWGRFGGPRLPPGHDVVLLIDVSRSMGALDAVPSRLAVAVETAESLVNALSVDPANRAAVAAFAGRGVLRCPLTENSGAVLAALARLRPGSLRPGGTDLGAALDAAIEAAGIEEHAQGRAVVLFSDGEDHANRWSSRLERLREQAIIVHTVAIGDPDESHPVPAGTSAGPLLYHGQPVRSRRSDAALAAIAEATGGSIVKLGLASVDLGKMYETKIEPLARRRRESTRLGVRTERFPLFLLGAFVLLLAASRPAGRNWSWPWFWTWSWRRSVKNLGAVSLFFVLADLATGAGDTPAKTSAELAAEAVLQGKAAYDQGRLEEAVSAFEKAISLAPRRAVPRYDLAATYFQLGRYPEARQLYSEASRYADGFLQTKVDYALGNTALAEGDIPGAISSYDKCLASTAGGAALDSVRRDAAINRRFALEQARSLAVPEGQSSGDQPQSQRPQRRRDPNRPGADDDQFPDGQPENEPGGGGTNPDTDGSGGPPPKNRRRLRGGGGGGSNSAGARGDSPRDRLDAALEHIRAAQSRRLDEESPRETANDDLKDW